MRNIACVAMVVMFAGSSAALAQSRPAEIPGVAALAGELLLNHRYLLTSDQRERLDDLNRRYREAQRWAKEAKTSEGQAGAAAKKAEISAGMLGLLEGIPGFIRVSIKDQQVTSSVTGPLQLPGNSGGLLLRIDDGNAETRCMTASQDLAVTWTDPVQLRIAPAGITWALVGFTNVPDRKITKQIDLLRSGKDKLRLTLDLVTPAKGRLRVTVLSDGEQPTPAMVRLTWRTNGNDLPPSNAIEFAPQFDTQGTASGRRFTSLPGRMGGTWWCSPGPFDMALAPGEYDLAVRRGVEHIPVFETLTIKAGETVERTIRLQRWTDMRRLGWYSGDDHIHCQILSDDDARRLMTWAQAEDVHLINVVKMGDIYRTYFEQRGFGKEYRVVQDDYTLSPGQECPRTHKELGHTIAMNITRMVRDTDKYFLYDWVFDNVHAQGGLTGYAHVNNDGFWVHCDISMNVPKGKVDFAEVLQFGVLGTPLYYAFLNLGCKLTASAGSDVPWGGTIGDVRVYAYTGQPAGGGYSADAWFEAFRRGHTFVTNGPMLELRVDDAMPGDEIRVTENRKLGVRARTWGHPARSLPAALEIIVHGETVKRVEGDGQTDQLALDFELDAGHGFWLAARAEAADGTKALTTPVYVIRDGLRFWKHDAAGTLIDQGLVYLGEIEKKTRDAMQLDAAARQEDYNAAQLARQGPELLKRIDDAKQIYAELKATIEKERPLRAK